MVHSSNYMFCFKFICFFSFLFCVCSSSDFKDFDDSIQFKINWPGPLDGNTLDPKEISDYLVVTTKDKEKFNCTIPVRKKKQKERAEDYEGPTAIELLQPLFQSPTCFSRIESYWTYEMCHGRYIRQYHEEKEGKKTKLQEYFLGRWNKALTSELNGELEKARKAGLSPPTKKIDGIAIPYLELNFTGGTVCDLNGELRQTSVQYMCLNNTKSDVLSVKEVATCVYQVNIFTQLLCKHPQYRPEENINHDLSCYQIASARNKPLNLLKMELESVKKRHFQVPTEKPNDQVFAVYTFDEQEGRMKVRFQFHSLGDITPETVMLGGREGTTAAGDERSTEEPRTPSDERGSSEVPPEDSGPSEPTASPPKAWPPKDIPFVIQEFLYGKHCLRGGAGWWKYKLCFGRSVEQYHIDKLADGSVQMTSILLGVFDKQEHLEWIKKNPHKRPKPKSIRTLFSQYYTGGDECEKTGRLRETEVRLKCVENKATVSLYLLEPQVCQYILGVESPLICDILNQVDDDGLIERPPPIPHQSFMP